MDTMIDAIVLNTNFYSLYSYFGAEGLSYLISKFTGLDSYIIQQMIRMEYIKVDDYQEESLGHFINWYLLGSLFGFSNDPLISVILSDDEIEEINNYIDRQ